MKILLTTLNTKFIHSCLSIRYLKAYSPHLPIGLREFTINQSLEYILSEIYQEEADVIGFSTYIWNVEMTLALCEALKLVKPDVQIILGGPEVSYDMEDCLSQHPYVDYIIYGEGEASFQELGEYLLGIKDVALDHIQGIAYRKDDQVVINPPRPLICDLDTIPSPYSQMGDDLANKIIYFESSRGCPFNCQFCLSSTIKGLRFFSLERVLSDLDRLIDQKVRQVKFVDRTFNARKDYALEIMKFIMAKDPDNINFHFEVTAHLIDQEMIDFLKTAKKGLFQFEIGVQSTNPKTLEAVGRRMDFNKLKKNVQAIEAGGNIHQHLDLIAGLPHEDYASFRQSFNDVYDIGVEKIQLGFLKLLKGSGLRAREKDYGFKYLDQPPYEVLENKDMSYREMARLKGIEDLVEKYHNEDYFKHSSRFIIKNYFPTPFDFFEDLLDYWTSHNYQQQAHSRNALYQILKDYCRQRDFDLPVVEELLALDYYRRHKNFNRPSFLKEKRRVDQAKKHDLLKMETVIHKINPDLMTVPTKSILHQVDIISFDLDLFSLIHEDYQMSDSFYQDKYYLFDYTNGTEHTRILDITKEAL